MNVSNVSDKNLSITAAPVTDFASWRPYFYICYIIFGGIALFINLTVIATLVKGKNLLAKWPTVGALTFGNLSSAVHSFAYGIYRLPLIKMGTIDLPLDSWICMATLVPTCHVAAYSIPPVIQCVIGVERLVAICAFNWYRVHWTPKKTWYAVSILMLITLAGTATPLWYKVFSKHEIVTRECSSPKIIGVDYLFSLIDFAIIIGVTSSLFSIGAFFIGRCRMKKMEPSDNSGSPEYTSQFKRQMKISYAMLTVAIFDLALVTVPSVLTVVQLSFEMPDSAKISLYSISYCIYSTVNVIVCVVMNTSLRNAAIQTLRIITCKLFSWSFGQAVTKSAVESIPVSQRKAWTENSTNRRQSSFRNTEKTVIGHR